MPEAISCDASDLAKASACYCYGNQKVEQSVMIYLLAEIAGDTSTPKELAEKAKCFCYGDQKVADSVVAYLLCQIANAA